LRSIPKSSAVLFFFVARRTNAMDIHGEMFPVYGVKVFSREAVHSWVQKFSQWRSKVANDAQLGAEVSETTARRLLC
jgi:hypothetical protein